MTYLYKSVHIVSHLMMSQCRILLFKKCIWKFWTQTLKAWKVQLHLAKLHWKKFSYFSRNLCDLELRMRTVADFVNICWLWKSAVLHTSLHYRQRTFLLNLAEISLMWPHLNIHCLFHWAQMLSPQEQKIAKCDLKSCLSALFGFWSLELSDSVKCVLSGQSDPAASTCLLADR